MAVRQTPAPAWPLPRSRGALARRGVTGRQRFFRRLRLLVRILEFGVSGSVGVYAFVGVWILGLSGRGSGLGRKVTGLAFRLKGFGFSSAHATKEGVCCGADIQCSRPPTSRPYQVQGLP